jgi:primosomal protein N'
MGLPSYAEVVINIEAAVADSFPLSNSRRYESAAGQIGHLVEVEFGRRLAQGIV